MRTFLVLGFLLLALGGGYVVWPYVVAFQTTGAAAVQAMTPQERAFLAQRANKIPSGATRSQVEQLLGTPYRNQSTGRPSWHGPTADSRVDVYFDGGRAFRIRWVRLGGFLWEKDLRR